MSCLMIKCLYLSQIRVNSSVFIFSNFRGLCFMISLKVALRVFLPFAGFPLKKTETVIKP